MDSEREEKAELKEDIDRAFDFCRRITENNECDMLIPDEIMGTISDDGVYL